MKLVNGRSLLARGLTRLPFAVSLDQDIHMGVTHSTQSSTDSRACWLPPNQVKARYGVAYVSDVCCQGGVSLLENPPDTDFMAVDAAVKFSFSFVQVQIKCTSSFKIGGRSATWPADPSWRAAWAESAVPVYFILVIVNPTDQYQWLEHDVRGTRHHAAAFWSRVDGLSDPGGIKISKRQRLTVDTLDEWASDLRACVIPPRRGD